MRILIVSDAWDPQVNGVVRTLKNTRRELERMGHLVDVLSPLEFRTVPCPTYPEIRLSLFPSSRVVERIERFAPDALHIATEGPLGLAARRFALRRRMPFTTAYHTRFPEYVQARIGLPLAVSYRALRWFHGPAHNVMVPTPVVKADLERYGFDNVQLWSRGVDIELFRPRAERVLDSKPPVFLYVGRVAVEKNVSAFLALDLPGSKWVVGEGPGLAALQRKHPDVHYLGVLKAEQLAATYASADVFVFPSKTDTFGLVLLEAMACGVPVAAYPVTGPIDVIADSGAGALHEDLRTACLAALKIDRAVARARAEEFSWRKASEQFVRNLRPAQPAEGRPLPPRPSSA